MKPTLNPTVVTRALLLARRSHRDEAKPATPWQVVLCDFLFKRRAWTVFLVILAFFTLAPLARTQFPVYQQPSVLTGATPGASLRNAAAATQTQASIVRQNAYDWSRRAIWSTYRVPQFQQDFANIENQFYALRQQFNGLGSLALQSGNARAGNAVAELDAGLNMIGELFTFLENQFRAGTLDNKTIARTARVLEDAIREWERELKKNNSRLGFVW